MAKIITDSTCDLTLDELDALNVEMIPLKVRFSHGEYIDKITLTNEEFFHKLEASDEIPTTSLLNPEDFYQIFQKYPEEDIVCLTVGSAYSGTFQSALIAKNMCERENIFLVDSQTVTLGLGLLIKVAAQLNASGISAKEIANKLDELSNRVCILAIMDTFKYLVKGGRLSSTAGLIGSVLHLKPILKVQQGQLLPLKKSRGSKAAFKELIALLEQTPPSSEGYPIVYGHSNNPSLLAKLMDSLPYIGASYCIGSAVGTHIGPGSIAIAFIQS